MEGWIALDIDGTITQDKYSVPARVIAFLKSLHEKGWRIALCTGRSFKFASMALTEFDFPYVFLPQNGSVVFQMPEKKVLYRRYIDGSELCVIEKALEGIGTDCLVYSGFEKGDFCYYRPDRFSLEDHKYLQELQRREKEAWVAVEKFEVASTPLIKCFGDAQRAAQIAKKLKVFEVAQIKDNFVTMDVLLVTHSGVSKGKSLSKFIQKGERVIAAGDDTNDLSLFDVADVKIAMPHAPEAMKKRADFIANSGIIDALCTFT